MSDTIRVNGVEVVGVVGFPQYFPGALHGTYRPIVLAGEPILRQVCQRVEKFGTAELEQLINDMFLTMYAADGMGLAANQIGVDLQLFVYDCTEDDGDRHVGQVLNPTIQIAPREERQRVVDVEGCLSVPGVEKDVARADHAIVQGFDLQGVPITIEGRDYFARCLIHETDHLQGRLYVDLLTGRHRRDALRSMHTGLDDVLAARAQRAQAILRS